jgi:hypothetical protein
MLTKIFFPFGDRLEAVHHRAVCTVLAKVVCMVNELTKSIRI